MGVESTRARRVSFSKRLQGLFKKARELSILCGADVAVVIFSGCGRLYEFSSSDMRQILARFNECVESKRGPASVGHKAEEPNRVSVLQQEIDKFKTKQRQLLCKDLTCMDLEELHALDKQLHQGLLCVTNKKEQILMQQIELSKMRKQQMMKENKILERQVEKIQHLIAPINYCAPPSTDHVPETTHNVWPADHKVVSDNILLLGYMPPSPKREDTDDGNRSQGNDSMV